MKYLIYCTKAKPMLENHKRSDNKYHCLSNLYDLKWCEENSCKVLNGHIVAEFECDKVEEITPYIYPNLDLGYHTKTMSPKELATHSCLSFEEMKAYFGTNKKGYAIHIENLKELDEPLTIERLYLLTDNNFCKKCKEYNTCDYAKSIVKPCKRVLLQAPQNMCYVWYKGEVCVLISIRSNWVCKILNREKTIEVRKKVLKEMIK